MQRTRAWFVQLCRRAKEELRNCKAVSQLKNLQPYSTCALRCGTALSGWQVSWLRVGCRDPWAHVAAPPHPVSPPAPRMLPDKLEPVTLLLTAVSLGMASFKSHFSGSAQVERWVEEKRQSQPSSKYWHKTITKHYCTNANSEQVNLWMSTAQERASGSCIHVHISSAKRICLQEWKLCKKELQKLRGGK